MKGLYWKVGTLFPMEYGQPIPDGKILAKERVTGGYLYYIVSYGTHPCIYIVLPKQKHKLTGKDYKEVNKIIYTHNLTGVHGGFSWSGDHIFDTTNRWILGWDYNHDEDKHTTVCPNGREYNIKELNEDVMDAIDLLKQINELR